MLWQAQLLNSVVFHLFKYRLDVNYLERWMNMAPKACAALCMNAKDFTCRSFNYQESKQMCTLLEDNIRSSGKLIYDGDWDYYERGDTQGVCDQQCGNGKCLNEQQICDGKYDCADKSDEMDCQIKPNLEIRLVGGSTPNEGKHILF